MTAEEETQLRLAVVQLPLRLHVEGDAAAVRILADGVDDLDSGDIEKDFAFLRDIGAAFLEIYPQLVARRKDMPFTEADRDRQLIKRGRYVEFNLVYDRGTKFGFATDANPDAYLMSLPPVVKWP